MDISIEFAPTSTSTLRRSEINFCLDSVIIEDRMVIVEDTGRKGERRREGGRNRVI